jgi:hypothetical protein
VAIDILTSLETYLNSDEFKDFKDVIKFHLIYFTDKPARRTGGTSERGHFELVTPLVAYDAVRLSRGAQLRGVDNLKRSKQHFIYLADEWFGPSLNWLLEERTKRDIEARSSWILTSGNEECCDVLIPQSSRHAHVPLTDGRAHELRKYTKVEPFVPNALVFDTLLDLVRQGEEPLTSAPVPAATPIQAPSRTPPPPK